MHGKYDYISTEQVLSAAKKRLRYSDVTDFDDELKMYINEGAMHMYNGQTYVGKKAVLDFDMGQAKVPCGYQKFGALFFAGENVFYADKKYFNAVSDVSGEQVIDSRGSVSEEIGGYLDVGCSRTGQATLWYIGANTDDEGWFLIPALAERGLVAYACGEFKSERPAVYGQNGGSKHTRLFAAQKGWLNGVIRQDEAENDKIQLAAIWNSRSMDRIDGYLGSIFNNL